jgi:hypothetical protein
LRDLTKLLASDCDLKILRRLPFCDVDEAEARVRSEGTVKTRAYESRLLAHVVGRALPATKEIVIVRPLGDLERVDQDDAHVWLLLSSTRPTAAIFSPVLVAETFCHGRSHLRGVYRLPVGGILVS